METIRDTQVLAKQIIEYVMKHPYVSFPVIVVIIIHLTNFF
jgi:hypothetical protein